MTFIHLSINFAGDFTIFVETETTDGFRFLYYTPEDFDDLGSGGYVGHGLGSGMIRPASRPGGV